jgi:hypothetical protein
MAIFIVSLEAFFVHDEFFPDALLMPVALQDTVIICSGFSRHCFKIRMLQNFLQGPGFKIDFFPIFFNQGEDVPEPVVVLGNIHAVRKTAGMDRTVGSDINGPPVKRLAPCMPVFFRQSLPVFMIHIPLDIDLDCLWYSAGFIVIP